MKVRTIVLLLLTDIYLWVNFTTQFTFKQQQKSIFLKLLVVDKSHQMLIS